MWLPTKVPLPNRMRASGRYAPPHAAGTDPGTLLAQSPTAVDIRLQASKPLQELSPMLAVATTQLSSPLQELLPMLEVELLQAESPLHELFPIGPTAV